MQQHRQINIFVRESEIGHEILIDIVQLLILIKLYLIVLQIIHGIDQQDRVKRILKQLHAELYQ